MFCQLLSRYGAVVFRYDAMVFRYSAVVARYDAIIIVFRYDALIYFQIWCSLSRPEHAEQALQTEAHSPGYFR